MSENSEIAAPVVLRALAPAAMPDDVSAFGSLLDSARAGDAGAFAEIYRRFARAVHGILVAKTGPTEAEDLTQEVFVSVHRGIGNLRDAATLPAWIATIARNKAADFLRRRVRPVPAESLEELPAPPAKDEERVLRERILARIGALPDAYRETLILRLVEGLTGPEIAEKTGMTHGSVRVNLTRGMAMLRPLLAEEGWP